MRLQSGRASSCQTRTSPAALPNIHMAHAGRFADNLPDIFNFAAPHAIAIIMVCNSASLIKEYIPYILHRNNCARETQTTTALPFAGHQQLKHVYATAFSADGYLQQGLMHVAAECWQQQQLETL